MLQTAKGVYASAWPRGAETVWTVVNRGATDVAGPQLGVEVLYGDSLFPLFFSPLFFLSFFLAPILFIILFLPVSLFGSRPQSRQGLTVSCAHVALCFSFALSF